MNLLLVEDEQQLAETLGKLLRKEHYLVDVVYDGEEAEAYARSGIYDAIILDRMLPKRDGLTVLKNLRAGGFDMPILLLTAKAEVYDKIEGLDAGADDYLAKPFAMEELYARVRALTRRHLSGTATGDWLRFADVQLNRATQELKCGEKSVSLSPKESLMLEVLLRNPEGVVSKECFHEKIWGFNSEVEYNAIEVYVSFLRRKLDAVRSNVHIRSVRSLGYRLKIEKPEDLPAPKARD